MEFTLEDIEIFKRVVKDYELLEKDINDKINKGYDISDLYDYIRHLASCYITCYEDNYDDYSCIDFNYCDMCCTICEDKTSNIKLHLSKSVDVWNDKELYTIGTFEIDEIIKIIKERG